MAFKAILQDASNATGTWAYTIAYVDETSGVKLERTYTADHIDDEVVAASARAEVARLGVVKQCSGQLGLVIGDEIDLAPPAPRVETPSAEEAARIEALQKRVELHQLMDDVRDGLLEESDARIVALRKALR